MSVESNLYWFCFTICDWLQNLVPLSHPITSETKTTQVLRLAHTRFLILAVDLGYINLLRVLTGWFAHFVTVVIGQSVNSGLGFRTLGWKPLCCCKFTVYFLNGRGDVGLVCRLDLVDKLLLPPLPARVNKPGLGSIGTFNKTQQNIRSSQFCTIVEWEDWL